jgi:hypothetical protein
MNQSLKGKQHVGDFARSVRSHAAVDIDRVVDDVSWPSPV